MLIAVRVAHALIVPGGVSLRRMALKNRASVFIDGATNAIWPPSLQNDTSSRPGGGGPVAARMRFNGLVEMAKRSREAGRFEKLVHLVILCGSWISVGNAARMEAFCPWSPHAKRNRREQVRVQTRFVTRGWDLAGRAAPPAAPPPPQGSCCPPTYRAPSRPVARRCGRGDRISSQH